MKYGWGHDPRKVIGRVLLWMMGFVLLSAWPAGAETASSPSGPSLSVSVGKDAAKVGELLWLTLTYGLPEGGRLPEEPAVAGLDALTIVEKVVRPGEIKFRFIVDRLDTIETDPVALMYVDKEGHEARIEAGPVSISVLSNLGAKPEDAVLRPIQDIIPTTARWMPFLAWGAGAGLVLCSLLAWLWRRRTHRRGRISAAPLDPPHIRAEKEIDLLASGGWFERGEVKTFYFHFSEIIRRYMASIRHFPAAEMTTEEIGRRVANTADQEILPLLRQADLVKFADAVPTPDRKEQDLEAARIYIRRTRPQPADARDLRRTSEAAS